MMRERAAWKLLGIEPCADERAVKRAYAAKLKEIDPDTDIQGFTQLREALQIARYDARYRKERDEHPERFVYEDEDYDEADEQDAVEIGDLGDAMFLQEPPDLSALNVSAHGNALDGDNVRVAQDLGQDPASMAPPGDGLDAAFGAPSQPDPIDEHFGALSQAVNKTPFVSKHDRQAREAVAAILADPRMEGIEFAENIEDWLANVLVDTIPKSDGAIEVADAHFGWRAELARATPRWRISGVAQRADDVACVNALADPDHRWHEAYDALQSGAPEDYSFGERSRLQPLVVELIYSLRQHNPGIEAQLLPGRVDSWMELGHVGMAPELVQSEGISWFGLILLALFATQIVRTAIIWVGGV